MQWHEHNQGEGYEDNKLYLEPVGEKPNQHGEVENLVVQITKGTIVDPPTFWLCKEFSDEGVEIFLTPEQYEKLKAYFS